MHAGIVADIFRWQQTLILPLDDRMALEYPCFEPRAIEHDATERQGNGLQIGQQALVFPRRQGS